MMIIFNGNYTWDGKKNDAKKPVSWWPGSYRVKIVDVRSKAPGVIHMKPYVCIFSDSESDYSVKNTFHNLAISISENFDLNPEKVLWIKNSPETEAFSAIVATLEKVTKIGKNTIYKTIWRQARPNEEMLIAQCGYLEH